MAEETIGGIEFELKFDGSKMLSSINSTCKKLKDSFTKSFLEAGKSAEQGLKTSNAEIQAILNDTARSAKSKAASIAAIYRKEGDSMSDAMSKAWELIERESKSTAKNSQKDMKKMAEQSEYTANEIKNNFSSSFSSIAKKAVIALAAAFSVKKIVDFGRECIELGSDLQEVQNVVDVTFPSMSKQVDDFASKAAASFGLSETMAKKFTGTFGAMAEAFGFSESAAYEMSTALTGLAGDVASFYNITQDEAYTKLKSVFTGETESLKDLGVVMTQTALDSYALGNGFGKTTAKMSEAEKVALRYQFVQEQLSAAAGDFIRTSDGWANQVRVLKLQFDSLKATIGQGLINVLTPVLKVINTLIGRLMTLASAFKSFTEMITGKKGTDSAAAGMAAVAEAADGAAPSTAAVGDAAASSAKKMGSLYAFDEVNVAEKPDSGGTSGSSGALSGMDFGSAAAPLQEAEEEIDSLTGKAKELAELFKKGFQIGLGDTGVFDSIENSLSDIKSSFLSIFTAPEVTAAAESFFAASIENLGKISGSVVSIGASIADNLMAGISGYLSGNEQKIRDYIVSMFDLGSRVSEMIGNVSVTLAEVMEAFRSDGAKQITESLTGIFAGSFMGLTELLGTLGTDLLDAVTAPFIENKDKLRENLEGALTAIAPVFEALEDSVNHALSGMKDVYNEHIQPMITSFKEGFTQIADVWLGVYNEHILPVLEKLSEKFSVFSQQYLDPLITKFQEFGGKAADAVTAIWENALQPFVTWFIENAYPIISEVLSVIIDIIFDLGAGIASVISGIMTSLSGIMDFITGVFTGDWELAWEGIKDFFGGIWDAIYGLLDGIIQAIYTLVVSIMTAVKDFFVQKWTQMQQSVTLIMTGVKTFISTTLNGIYSGINNILTKLKKFWENIWESMKNTVVGIFNGIWTAIKGVINSILGGVEGMANGIVRGLNKAIEALNRISFDIPEWVPGLGGMSFGFDVPQIPEISLPRLAQGGYVKPNTPQLAMIGDNLHQGEIVAPEDKLYQISAKAMQDVMQQFIGALTAAGTGQRNVTIVLKVTGEMAPFVRLLKTELDKESARAGINFEVVYE